MRIPVCVPSSHRPTRRSGYCQGPDPLGRRQRGDSLAEVLVALWLLGSVALGSVALHMTLAKAQDGAGYLARAVRVAQSAAEALRGGIAAPDVLAVVRGGLAGLPDGKVSIAVVSAELAQVTVHWSEPRGRYETAQPACGAARVLRPGWVARCLALQVPS